MDYLSLGIGAVESLVGTVSGLIQMNQGNEAAQRNVRPTLGNTVVNDYKNLLSLYEQQAQYGIDPSALNFVAGKNENALAATLQSMLLAGASPNSVGNAYASFTDAMGSLGVQESDKRWQKIQALAPITEQLANAKLQQFLYDEDAPYKDKAQAAAAKQNAGYQQFFSGLDSLGGNIMKQVGADKYYSEQNKLLESILGQKPGATVAGAPKLPATPYIDMGLINSTYPGMNLPKPLPLSGRG